MLRITKGVGVGIAKVNRAPSGQIADNDSIQAAASLECRLVNKIQ